MFIIIIIVIVIVVICLLSRLHLYITTVYGINIKKYQLRAAPTVRIMNTKCIAET